MRPVAKEVPRLFAEGNGKLCLTSVSTVLGRTEWQMHKTVAQALVPLWSGCFKFYFSS